VRPTAPSRNNENITTATSQVKLAEVTKRGELTGEDSREEVKEGVPHAGEVVEGSKLRNEGTEITKDGKMVNEDNNKAFDFAAVE